MCKKIDDMLYFQLTYYQHTIHYSHTKSLLSIYMFNSNINKLNITIIRVIIILMEAKYYIYAC